MTNRRLRNSELKLLKLEEEEAEREGEPGVLELFARPDQEADADAPLARDDTS